MILIRPSVLLLILLFPIENSYSAKIKDIVSIKGVRENPLVGYGLIIGLAGTGDNGGEITNSSLIRMFKNLGLNLRQEIAAKNVAAVVVMAKLPSFARQGQRFDVTVSSVADATSLRGGTLLITPLKGGDNQVYAVAAGAVSVGGNLKKNTHKTTALIPNGAFVEKEIEQEFNNKKSIRFGLHNPDFTTAARIQKTINQHLGGKYAIAKDAATVDIMIPAHYDRRVVPLISIIENFQVNPSQKAKIVINERTGTVIAGGDILLKNVAISHQGLTLEINNPEKTNNSKKEKIYLIDKKQTTLNDLVRALNQLGAGPEDIISIFQALKSNGTLTGQIELI